MSALSPIHLGLERYLPQEDTPRVDDSPQSSLASPEHHEQTERNHADELGFAQV